MLLVLSLVQLITNVGDLLAFFIYGLSVDLDRFLSIFVFLHYITAVIASGYLWKQMTAISGQS